MWQKKFTFASLPTRLGYNSPFPLFSGASFSGLTPSSSAVSESFAVVAAKLGTNSTALTFSLEKVEGNSESLSISNGYCLARASCLSKSWYKQRITFTCNRCKKKSSRLPILSKMWCGQWIIYSGMDDRIFENFWKRFQWWDEWEFTFNLWVRRCSYLLYIHWTTCKNWILKEVNFFIIIGHPLAWRTHWHGHFVNLHLASFSGTRQNFVWNSQIRLIFLDLKIIFNWVDESWKLIFNRFSINLFIALIERIRISSNIIIEYQKLSSQIL